MIFQLASRKFALRASSAKIFQSLFAASPYAFWLDSSVDDDKSARFSFMGDSSGPYAYRVQSFLQSNITVVRGERYDDQSLNIFDFLDQELTQTKLGKHTELPFDFYGGFIGYFGYELMTLTEHVPGYRSALPDATLLFVDRFISIDHATGELYLVALYQEDISIANDWFSRVEGILSVLPIRPDESKSSVCMAHIEDIEPFLLHGRGVYLEQVAIAKEQILQGGSYEICLTNRVRVPISLSKRKDIFEAYLTLRTINPAPYACLLYFDSTSVLCSSPEQFLKISPGGIVEAKPIKGTIRRGVTSAEDDANRERLLYDEKFFSEHIMIVDLIRNDLSRSCLPGSIHVPALMQVESFVTVHQLVSTIRGTLQESAIHCISRCFPGGSMTGAPKKRTLEIINTLEDAPRGIYSGAIGYLSLNGTASLNMVIRTIVIDGNVAEIGVGGAIIHLSDAEEEYEEMLLKAVAPFTAVKTLMALSPSPDEDIFDKAEARR